MNFGLNVNSDNPSNRLSVFKTMVEGVQTFSVPIQLFLGLDLFQNIFITYATNFSFGYIDISCVFESFLASWRGRVFGKYDGFLSSFCGHFQFQYLVGVLIKERQIDKQDILIRSPSWRLN